MNREETNRAIRDSLLRPDKRSDSHNVYRLRPRQEDAVVTHLYPRARKRLDNVAAFVPRDAGPPMTAA